jgi:hypothetical protein
VNTTKCENDVAKPRTLDSPLGPELIATKPNEIWSWDIERHEVL